MSSGYILIFVFVMMALAMFNIWTTVSEDNHVKRNKRIVTTVLSVGLAISAMGFLHVAALSDKWPDMPFVQLIPLGIILGLALMDMGKLVAGLRDYAFKAAKRWVKKKAGDDEPDPDDPGSKP